MAPTFGVNGAAAPPVAGKLTVVSVPSLPTTWAERDAGRGTFWVFTTVLLSWTEPFCRATPVKSFSMTTPTPPLGPMVTPVVSAPAGAYPTIVLFGSPGVFSTTVQTVFRARPVRPPGGEGT